MTPPAAPPGRTAVRLPRLVVTLGAVSFCTDVASEMIVPLLPTLMAGLGGSMLALGALQGLSDLAVSLLKLMSGWLSDRQRRRKPWILWGYAGSAVLRPLFAVVASPWQAVFVRTADRIGKGIRQAPRDALLAQAAPHGMRGRAFGLVRSMDHAGALVGALVAYALLSLGVGERSIFAAALWPGLFGVLLIALLVRDLAPAPAAVPAATAEVPGDPRRLRPFLVVVVLSAFGGSVDLFLLARASSLGAETAWLPLIWAMLHLVRSLLAAPLGGLSDRLGRKAVIGCGLVFQTVSLAAIAAASSLSWLLPLILVHGLHAAFCEGAERGLVADLTGAERRGFAYGLYHAVQGLAAFVAPIAIGWLWEAEGPPAAFLLAAAASLLSLLALLALVEGDREDATP